MVRIVYHNKKIEHAERSLDACWVTEHTCAGGGSPTGGRPEGQAAGDRRCRPSSPRGWHRPRGARLRGLTDAGSLVHRGPHGERLPGARAHPSGGPCAQPPAPEERAPRNVRRKRRARLMQPGLPPRPDPDGGTGSQDRRRWEGLPAAPPAHGQGSPAARPAALCAAARHPRLLSVLPCDVPCTGTHSTRDPAWGPSCHLCRGQRPTPGRVPPARAPPQRRPANHLFLPGAAAQHGLRQSVNDAGGGPHSRVHGEDPPQVCGEGAGRRGISIPVKVTRSAAGRV